MRFAVRPTHTIAVFACSLGLIGCGHAPHKGHSNHPMGDFKPLAMVVLDNEGRVQLVDQNGKEVPPLALVERVTTVPPGMDPKGFDVYKVTPIDGKQRSSADDLSEPALRKVGLMNVQAKQPCKGYIYTADGRKIGIPAGCAP